MCDERQISVDEVERLVARELDDWDPTVRGKKLEEALNKARIGTVVMLCQGPNGTSGPGPHIQRADVEKLRQHLGQAGDRT